MNNCPFCKIIAGEIPASIVYQDERCLAFMDIQPINPGHVLVSPKEHIEHFADLNPALSSHLIQVTQQLARGLMDSGIESEGFNIFLADGAAAMQEVPHTHLHIIPRFEGDGFEFQFSPRYFELPTRDELDKNAHFINKALSDLHSEDQ